MVSYLTISEVILKRLIFMLLFPVFSSSTAKEITYILGMLLKLPYLEIGLW